MSLIKDKDRYKKVLRQERTVSGVTTKVSNKRANITQEQRVESTKQARKESKNELGFVSINESTRELKINSIDIVADSYSLITTLSPGETLIDIIATSSRNEQVFSMYYTTYNSTNLEITHDASLITLGETDDKLNLLQYHVNSSLPGSYTFRDKNQTTQFVNVNKTLYFYLATKPACTVTVIKK